MEQPIVQAGPPPLLESPHSRPAATVQSCSHLAFEHIMRRYNQRLYRLAFGLVGDAAEAEDVLQDSYVRAYLKFATFAGHSSLGTWLACIVRNESIDHLRTRRARQAAFSLEAELPFREDGDASALEQVPEPATFSNPESCRSREEARAVLEQAIAALPYPFRAVFLLREVEGLSVEETADYLGIPVATVKSRDHRARLQLRAELGSTFDGRAEGAFEFLRESCDRIVARVRSLLTGAVVAG
jgi:RNA polymerase sigma factor (sigma-70 family)